jgi:hypothetical protein
MSNERLITQKEWQDKCRELRKEQEKTTILRAALTRIAGCDDGDNPHFIEDDEHNPFLIAREALGI